MTCIGQRRRCRTCLCTRHSKKFASRNTAGTTRKSVHLIGACVAWSCHAETTSAAIAALLGQTTRGRLLHELLLVDSAGVALADLRSVARTRIGLRRHIHTMYS